MAGYTKQEAMVEAKRRGLISDGIAPAARATLDAAMRVAKPVLDDPAGAALDVGAAPADAIIDAGSQAGRGDLWPAAALLDRTGVAVNGAHAAFNSLLDQLAQAKAGGFVPEIVHAKKLTKNRVPVPPFTNDPNDILPQRYDDDSWVKQHFGLPGKSPTPVDSILPMLAGAVGSLLGGRFGRGLTKEAPLWGETIGSGLGAGSAAGGTASQVDPKHMVADTAMAGFGGLSRPLVSRGLQKALDLVAQAPSPTQGSAYFQTKRVPGGRNPLPAPFDDWEDIVGTPRKTGPNRHWSEEPSQEQKYINEVVSDMHAKGAPVPYDVPITASPSVVRVPKPAPPPTPVARASHPVMALGRWKKASLPGVKEVNAQLGIVPKPGQSHVDAFRAAVEGPNGQLGRSEKARMFQRIFPAIVLGTLGETATQPASDSDR